MADLAPLSEYPSRSACVTALASLLFCFIFSMTSVAYCEHVAKPARMPTTAPKISTPLITTKIVLIDKEEDQNLDLVRCARDVYSGRAVLLAQRRGGTEDGVRGMDHVNFRCDF
jgi:hypothetical protein